MEKKFEPTLPGMFAYRAGNDANSEFQFVTQTGPEYDGSTTQGWVLEVNNEVVDRDESLITLCTRNNIIL